MRLRGLSVFYIACAVTVMLYGCAGLATQSEPARRSFVSAARRGDITSMRLWMLAGARADAWAPAGGGEWPAETALEAAVKGGQAEAVRLLLAHGAEVSGDDLSLAVEQRTPEVRDLLLTERNGRRVCHDSGGGATLLAASEAGREEVVRLLLSCGCGAEVWDGDWGVKEKALRRAIIHNQRGVVAALLEAGTNVNHLSESETALGGITVLQVARNHNNPEIIALVRQAGAR